MHDLLHAVIQGDCFMQKQSSFLEDLNNHSRISLLKDTQVNNNLTLRETWHAWLPGLSRKQELASE